MHFECFFCQRHFAALPFFGCCGGYYAGSAEVRAVVDDAHPQTWPSAMFDFGGSRVPNVDALLDAELAREAQS